MSRFIKKLILLITFSLLFLSCENKEIKQKKLAITQAISENNIEKLEELFSDGTDVNIRLTKKFGKTPLIFAVEKNQSEAVKLLLEKEADVNLLYVYKQNKEECTESAIGFAIKNNNLEIIELLLSNNKEKLEDLEYLFPLYSYLISQGKTEIFEIFLKHGLSPDFALSFVETDTGRASTETFLFYAVSCEKLEIVQLLLKYGANTDIISSQEGKENTPLYLAVSRDLNEFANILLEAKANPNIIAEIPSGKMSLLTMAAYNKNKYIFDELLKAGSKVNEGYNHYTSFSFLLNNSSLEFLERLSKGNFDYEYYKKRIQIYGHAHIFSRTDLSSLYEKKSQGLITKLSADDLYKFYDKSKNEYKSNSLLWRKKEEEFKNTLILISGTVNLVRKSIFSEYIVELNTTDGIWGTSIVFPRDIPSETIDKLMLLKKGDNFESLAFTRDGYAYVDVPVWKKGETYYVEP